MPFKLPSVAYPELPALFGISIFNDARLRVYRARRHTHEACTIFRKNAETGLDKLGVQFNNETGLHEFRVGLEMHPAVFLAVGDAVHSLRCGLDYIVSSLARLANLNDKRTLFPFHERRTNVEDMFRPRDPPNTTGQKRRDAGSLHELWGAYPDLKDIMLDEVQPYSADDGAKALGDLLWRLADADNIDKHRLLMPTLQASTSDIINYGTSSVIGGTWIGFTIPPIAFVDQPNAKFDYTITLGIVFGDETRFAGQPVFDTLVQCADAVEHVIAIMESLPRYF